ncbi:MAG: DNA ligase D, partial [Syntrophomonadaceae bacterium]|nr:DNA ligase D [Syntrophomonadaceae bacterium]
MKKTDDPLSEYKEKRDFGVSPEPGADLAAEKSFLTFVVHKHLARHPHYDLRLELQGVLKSWAVPKGPSLDPTHKRLAVPVEDHPLAYSDFEGEIPPKQYGAGAVIIWDRGNWEPLGDPQAGLSAGNLKFRLHGQKLRGSWALVRMKKKSGDKKDSWLLVKERDAFARPETDSDVSPSRRKGMAAGKKILTLPEGAKPSPLPAVLSPQLATLVDKVPANADWIYEIKLDGYRILARIEGPEVKLFTRNGQDWTSKLKDLVPAIGALGIDSGWLDGELVIFGGNGLPDFGALQAAFDSSRMEAIHYYVFDLPFYAGFDLRETKLVDRRVLLAQIVGRSATEQIRFSEDFNAPGRNIYASACRLGMEGIMGKNKDSAYVSGRTRSWIKLKCTKQQEFVLVGYTESKARKERLKAMLLGFFDEFGRLRYAGRVGTGFDNLTEAKLKQRLDSLSMDSSPLYDPPNIEARWVKPELAAEIAFSGWTKDGKVRHPVFRGLRDDKPTKDIVRETALNVTGLQSKDPQPPPYQSGLVASEYLGLTISNPTRVIDPSTGLRKADLADYYQRAARWILPQLDNRPVSFLRAPAGIQGQLFFQKHAETLRIQGLKVFDI